MRMDIRNGLDGLKSLFGVESTASVAARPTCNSKAGESGTPGNDRATLSSAGSQVSQVAQEDGVRTEKVASIQAALASGTYNVPAAGVATKVVDAMFSGQK
jgi:negative regulator of flagellin synthesis FlgM